MLFRIEKNVKVAKSSNPKIENVRAKIACVTSVNPRSAHSFWYLFRRWGMLSTGLKGVPAILTHSSPPIA